MKKTKYSSYHPDQTQKTYVETEECNHWTLLTKDPIVHAIAISLLLVTVTSCWVTIFPRDDVKPSINHKVKVGEYGR